MTEENRSLPTHRDLQTMVTIKLEEYQKKHTGGSLLQQSISVVKKMEGFISIAASQEPHAAVAWAAVSLLLPVSIAFAPSLIHVNTSHCCVPPVGPPPAQRTTPECDQDP